MIRQRLFTSMLIIAVFVIIGILGSSIAWMSGLPQDTFKRSNLIRLRVIANSDSPTDQQLKFKVRDRVVHLTEPMLIRVEDPAEAEAIIIKNLALIKAAAKDELARYGSHVPVQVSIGKFDFPDVTYPFGTLPAGEYKGVKVILGEGKGHNWWCVLYPPLCLLSPDAPGFRTPSTQHPKIEYRLALLEEMLKQKGLTMNQFWNGWGKFFGLI